MARPKFVPTEEQRRTVKSLAAYGIKQEGIARTAIGFPRESDRCNGIRFGQHQPTSSNGREP